MARAQEQWITTREAARMLTDQGDHPVSSDYVRLLGRIGKVKTRQLDLRTKLYSRADVLGYQVRRRVCKTSQFVTTNTSERT